MNFSSISIHSVCGKLLRFPLKFIPPNMKIFILQGKLRGKKWIIGSGVHGYWLGSYEYKKRILFERTIKPGSIVFDIGAHVGFYTLLASESVGSSGKVFAFPRNIFYLSKHLEMNHITNVIIVEVAVFDSNGEVFFEEFTSDSQGHISKKGKLKVKTLSLDEEILQKKMPLPNYIKIDAEGAELEILAGAKLILSKYKPTLFLSTHGDEIHKKCCAFLYSRGYHLYPLDQNRLEAANEILASGANKLSSFDFLAHNSQ